MYHLYSMGNLHHYGGHATFSNHTEYKHQTECFSFCAILRNFSKINVLSCSSQEKIKLANNYCTLQQKNLANL